MKYALILTVFSLSVSTAAIANNGKTGQLEKHEPPKSQNERVACGSIFFSLFELFVPDTATVKAKPGFHREEKEEKKR